MHSPVETIVADQSQHTNGGETISPLQQSMREGIEQRKHQRVPADNHVAYKASGPNGITVGHGTLVDLSEDGCQIRGDRTVHPGDHIELIIYADGEHEESATVLQGCRVAWVVTGQYGVQFTWDPALTNGASRAAHHAISPAAFPPASDTSAPPGEFL